MHRYAPNERVLLSEVRNTVVAMAAFVREYAAGFGGPGATAEPPVTTTATDPRTEGPPPTRKFTFPSALTILAVVTVAIWLLAFLVPAGVYDRNDDGAPVQGTYHRVDSGQSFVDRLNDLFLSPVNGLYGVQDAKTGVVGPGPGR